MELCAVGSINMHLTALTEPLIFTLQLFLT